MTIYLPIVFLILFNLPTLNLILLNLLCLQCMTTVIINAMSHQKVTALCLLDLSAAFDTIDHSILLERLSSWFGLNGTVLTWIKSYLTSRSFKVCLNGVESSLFQLLYGVPQGSVLGPLLFTLYTTPLSSIISQSPVNHHL